MIAELKSKLIKHADWLNRMRDENGLLPVGDIGIHMVWIDHFGFRGQSEKQACAECLVLRLSDSGHAAVGKIRRRQEMDRNAGTAGRRPETENHRAIPRSENRFAGR